MLEEGEDPTVLPSNLVIPPGVKEVVLVVPVAKQKLSVNKVEGRWHVALVDVRMLSPSKILTVGFGLAASAAQRIQVRRGPRVALITRADPSWSHLGTFACQSKEPPTTRPKDP